jgi:hypothetical protein
MKGFSMQCNAKSNADIYPIVFGNCMLSASNKIQIIKGPYSNKVDPIMYPDVAKARSSHFLQADSCGSFKDDL